MTVTSHILLYSACASNIASSPVSSLFAQPFSKDTPGLYKDDPASPVRYYLFSPSHRAEPKPIQTISTEVVANRDRVRGILCYNYCMPSFKEPHAYVGEPTISHTFARPREERNSGL